jgi:hypothetical protein
MMGIKKYLSIFNLNTALVLALSMLSCYISLHFHLSLYIDFLILGIVVVFPLTFSLRMAFRRRENALQYLSLFKASLQSLVYAFETSELKDEKKNELRFIVKNISDELIEYLTGNKTDASMVQHAFHSIYLFTERNKSKIGQTFSLKIFLFITRVNESIEFLLATRRHNIPWGPKAIVLFAIYIFAIFYPIGLLNKIGFDESFWYVFAMTGVKVFLLISFYNIQYMLEDPFNQNSPDGIRINDFRINQS